MIDLVSFQDREVHRKKKLSKRAIKVLDYGASDALSIGDGAAISSSVSLEIRS